MSITLAAPLRAAQSAESLEHRILAYIDEEAVVGLDALIELLPRHSWSQIFNAVDRLTRLGKITLRRHGFDYTVFSNNYAD